MSNWTCPECGYMINVTQMNEKIVIYKMRYWHEDCYRHRPAEFNGRLLEMREICKAELKAFRDWLEMAP